jgi:hypothetical protein
MATKRSLALSVAVAFAAAALCAPPLAAAPEGQADEACLDAQVGPLTAAPIGGTARLCAGGAGVRADLSAEQLTGGEAYTIWFVYFDNPAACAAQPCAGADALGDDPVAVFSRMDGVVADGAGAARFAGTVRDLRLSKGSVVWLLMFGHGPANAEDNRARARQLLTPQSPMLGAPAAGAAADGEIGKGVARAVFALP